MGDLLNFDSFVPRLRCMSDYYKKVYVHDTHPSHHIYNTPRCAAACIAMCMKIWYLPSFLLLCRHGDSLKFNIDEEIEYYRYVSYFFAFPTTENNELLAFNELLLNFDESIYVASPLLK